jgi:hypothetical protein
MDEAQVSFALGRQSALAEAHGLYRMIQPERGVEELRELIAVPPHIERALRAYAKAHVEDARYAWATLRISFPVFSPLKSFSNVSGNISRPSTISSRDLILPAAIHAAISRAASA